MTKIEWTEQTWNPIAGCSLASPGCTNCYAMRRVAPRLASNPATPHYHGTVEKTKAGYVWTGKIGIAADSVFFKPLKRKKPTMYFVNSTSDLFHEDVPDEVIDRVFAVMSLCPQHTFQILTKRADRMAQYLTNISGNGLLEIWAVCAGGICGDRGLSDVMQYYDHTWPLPNVWLGVSVEDQKRADERITALLRTPAAIRFVSYEPALGPVDFENIQFPLAYGSGFLNSLSGKRHDHYGVETLAPHSDRFHLDWIIAGGESGKGARPAHPDWFRTARDQCKTAGVAFLFKQHGEWCEVVDKDATHWIDFDDGCIYERLKGDTAHIGAVGIKHVGKKAAGRLLDGVEQSDSPWFYGKYDYVLRDPRPCEFIPMKGQLGFFRRPEMEGE